MVVDPSIRSMRLSAGIGVMGGTYGGQGGYISITHQRKQMELMHSIIVLSMFMTAILGPIFFALRDFKEAGTKINQTKTHFMKG